MVQLSLPRGSKPTKGKVHKAPAGAKNVKTYKVYRYDPEVDDPDWDNYPFKWGGVVPEAWALEFIAKYLKEHNPGTSSAPAPAPAPAACRGRRGRCS